MLFYYENYLAPASKLHLRFHKYLGTQTVQPSHPEICICRDGQSRLTPSVGHAITVEPRLRDVVWTVLCDPSQLENALLNLAINARDAMTEGGTLTIATADVRLTEADVAGEQLRQSNYHVLEAEAGVVALTLLR